MTKAKLALVVVALSNLVLVHSAVAADNESTAATPQTEAVIQEKVMPPAAINAEMPAPSLPGNLAQDAISDMMQFAGIFAGDMPAPPGRTNLAKAPLAGQSLAVNPNDAPPLDGHMTLGMGPPGMSGASGMHGMHPMMGGPGMIGPGMGGMCPMISHLRCPLTMLEGANALTDDQYQKLYDIKTQFIATIVPKGLNVFLLAHKMKDLLTASDIDSTAVKDAEKQISSGTSDISMTVMDSIVTALRVLTPEQRKELHNKMIRGSFGGGWKHHDDQHAPHPEK